MPILRERHPRPSSHHLPHRRMGIPARPTTTQPLVYVPSPATLTVGWASLPGLREHLPTPNSHYTVGWASLPGLREHLPTPNSHYTVGWASLPVLNPRNHSHTSHSLPHYSVGWASLPGLREHHPHPKSQPRATSFVQPSATIVSSVLSPISITIARIELLGTRNNKCLSQRNLKKRYPHCF
jgi:hypothetical protein